MWNPMLQKYFFSDLTKAFFQQQEIWSRVWLLVWAAKLKIKPRDKGRVVVHAWRDYRSSAAHSSICRPNLPTLYITFLWFVLQLELHYVFSVEEKMHSAAVGHVRLNSRCLSPGEPPARWPMERANAENLPICCTSLTWSQSTHYL